MPARSILARLSRHEKITELFPVIAYTDDDFIFLMEDKAIGFMFNCAPIAGGDDKMGERLSALLTLDWPKNTFIQVQSWLGPDIADTLTKIDIQRHAAGVNDTVLAATDSEVEFLRTGTKRAVEPNSGTIIRDHKVLFTAKLPIGGMFPTDKEIGYAVELRKAAKQTLENVYMAPQEVNAQQYIRIMQTMLNWSPDAPWRDEVLPHWNKNEFIRDQLFDYDNYLEVERDGINLGGHKKAKVLSIKRFPVHSAFGMAARYLGDMLQGVRGIRENVILSVTMHLPDSEARRASLEKDRQWVTHQAYGPMLKFNPKLAERKNSFDALFEALDDGDRVVEAYFGVVVFADKHREAAAVSNIRSYLREGGFQVMEDKYFTLPLFLTCLPFGADAKAKNDLMRFKTMASRHAVTLLPVFGDWAGTGTPLLNLITRNGRVLSMSPFDSPTNYNGMIAAQSGSGKSVLANAIAMALLSMGGRIWIIDVGRSYKNLCEIVGGQFIEFGTDSNICLNPFDKIQEFDEDEAEVVTGLVAAMAAPEQPYLDNFQMSNLKRVLKETWEAHKADMSIDLLADALKAEGDRRVQDIGHQLYAFTSKGSYGRYFNGKNNVEMNNDMVVLELEELKAKPHLQQIVLLQLIYQMQNSIYLGARDRPLMCLIDEAWDLLTKGKVKEFIEAGYRRFRKYSASVLICVQSMLDTHNENGRAIKENSANLFLLQQKGDTVEAMKSERIIDLSAFGFELLKSVRTVPGQYSEIFVRTERGMGIGKLILEPFKRLLYSTKPDDITAIRRKKDMGYTTADAINEVLRERGIA